jgi:hypothetical protein
MRSSGTSSPRPTACRNALGATLGLVAVIAAGCSSSSSSVGGTDAIATATVCPGSSSNVSIPTIDAAGGQRTPVAAAVFFAKHGNVGGVPTTGWKVIVQNKDGAYLRSGAAIIHAGHLTDGTWLVDHESTCRS